MPAIEAHPLIDEQVGEHDHGQDDGGHDGGVQVKDEHGGEREGDERHVDRPDQRPSPAGLLGVAARAGGHGLHDIRPTAGKLRSTF
jgi:hypothetical protein